ncbi:ATP-binding protein [Anaeromassilibacillus senegalensis]|uniref:ATP-binding protein n=1 Tax=Anaeromassilibacillus senegalensis TaxID=1673717 RepID=UPI000681D393|nr:DUF87 domain-containing protein [Anaeromassilibacillus senegalensis]
MKQLISVITAQILRQVKENEINMVRLENFDDPVIYKAVCENLRDSAKISNFVAKLTHEKYSQFTERALPNWAQSIQFLHQGANSAYFEERSPEYEKLSYVDFEQAITKWRNEPPNMPAGQTSLILLMGTDAAIDDAGSLGDTTFVISPREIISLLSSNYSEWFSSVLNESSYNKDEAQKAIHTLYRALFANINVNIFRLSAFIDSLHEMNFASCQDLVGHICETFNETWSIPSIIDSKYVPRVSSLSKGNLTAAKIITNAYRFIERADDIPSASAVKKLHVQFEKYADQQDLDITSPFPADTGLFQNYYDFEECVINFKRGIDLNTNRSKLLQVDYSIIERITGTKLPKEPSEKTPVITGAPMEAYSHIFLYIADKFYAGFRSYPTHYKVQVDSISLSDCIDDNKEDAFRNVCNFLGGILSFYNSSNLMYEDESVEFAYDKDMDPFDFKNQQHVIERVKSTGKWGEPCKIHFTVTASNEIYSHKYEFKWAFSPYTPWLNAFSYLGDVLFRKGDSYTLPTLVICKNIQDYLRCESEDEFYAQLNQVNDEVVYREHCNEIYRYFTGNTVTAVFDKLCNDFKDFSIQLIDHGFYAALDLLRKVVATYTELMQYIQTNYNGFTDVQKEKIALLLNCFMIASNVNVIETCNVGEVLFPAYHPVMLEKIDAQQLFLRDGFAELASSKMEGNVLQNTVVSKLESLGQLSSITQGADFIVKGQTTNLTCKSMWEYYGVYFDADISNELISGKAFGNAIVTDDEDASAMLHTTPVSDIVVRNVMDYIRTFPARVDGLNIAFIAPTDMQHIVAAIHSIAKQLETNDTLATINLRIICLNNKRNSATYLKKWLDSYFDDERNIKVNTYLRNITIRDKSDADVLEDLLRYYDLCFNYDILQGANIWFDRSGDEIIDKDHAKFPMTFTPDTISATHGKSRKVSISQFQFLAAKEHTQANYIVSHPNSLSGVYRTFRTLELREIQNHIIEIAHDTCKWVVCIDPAIDRKMLETTKSRIIGFTTGEGSYGELNVTVSARKDILGDIKQMLQKRIQEKFTNWDEDRLQMAAEYCVDNLSQFMDGSRILKALNPYDYEIHSFLAYILTMQMLGLTEANDNYAVRVLVSLDSHKHWFADDDELSKDNKRPDFVLIEIPKTSGNLDPSEDLSIKIKIIECKMGFRNGSHIEKAEAQLEKGLRTMSLNWDPSNTSIMHRYWRNQLYRAIIFSPLNLDNTSVEYNVIRNKIYGILSGKYQVEWTGDIFAFWLDSNADSPVEENIDSSLPDELSEHGVALNEMICHYCGQMYIQKMLLPPEERTATFIHNDIASSEGQDNLVDDDEEEAADPSAPIPTGESIPRATEVYLPFLHYLADGQDHTRQSSLAWFASHFSIKPEDQSITYDNGHYKWETTLDAVITFFRKNGVLENRELASFHLTKFGHSFAAVAEKLLISRSFEAAINAHKEAYSCALLPENLSDVEDKQQNIADEIPGKGEIAVMPQLPADEKPALAEARFLIGEDLRTKEKFYWEFGNKSLNNRHLLINGNSGCGKTYCIQTLLLEMVHSGISGVVFDYTSGFTPDKLEPAFVDELGEKIQQRVIYIDKIPVNPFAKQIIKVGGREVPEGDTSVATRMANVFTTVYGFGGQQKSALYKAIRNGLQHHKEAMSFSCLEDELNDVNAKQAETVLSKIQPFLDLAPFAEDEDFSWSSIRDSEGMVYIMQLDGFDRPTQLLLTELLLWDIWNYCVKNGNEDHPFVIVLDEAQNLSHAAESPSAKFLTEGRKFGISAWYATQFMKSQLSDDEIQRLQQAGQKLYFCPPDEGVMTVAKNIDIDTQGAKEWAPRLKALKKGECVTCGNMIRNGKWAKYEPRIVKVTSLQERLSHD